MMKTSCAENIRIVLTVTQKDLIDGIKNKNVISILVSCLFVVVLYKYLPGLTAEDGPPTLHVYAPTQSSLLDALEESPAVDLKSYGSLDDMVYSLTNGDKPELGLVIPADSKDWLDSGNQVELQGYALQIYKENQVHSLKRRMELEFESILGRPVTIAVERILLQPETYGITVITGLGFSFVTLMIGITSIPHMMIEEKQEKTQAVLSVSPAAPAHNLTAKALTGLIFTLGMLLITVGFNWVLVYQRWLFLLGGLMGALFSISLGILLGTTIESRQQLTLWAWVVIIPLFIPMVLVLLDDLLPAGLVRVFTWFPTSALFQIYRVSMAGSAPIEYYGPQFGILAACTAVFLGFDAWLIRHLNQDRN